MYQFQSSPSLSAAAAALYLHQHIYTKHDSGLHFSNKIVPNTKTSQPFVNPSDHFAAKQEDNPPFAIPVNNALTVTKTDAIADTE